MKRVSLAYVRLWDQLVGAVAWDADQRYATFEFDRGFLDLGLDIAPIEMPITEQVYEVLFEGKPPEKTVEGLMMRDRKPEYLGN